MRCGTESAVGHGAPRPGPPLSAGWLELLLIPAPSCSSCFPPVRGALARTGMPIGIFNDLLKILLAFGGAAAVVMHAVVAGDSFQTLSELPKGFFSFGEDSLHGELGRLLIV